MRPCGEIRTAITSAAIALTGRAMGEFTYKDLAVSARVGYRSAQASVKEMTRCGDLEPCGSRALPGIKRPLRTYRLIGRKPQSASPLANAMRGWATGH